MTLPTMRPFSSNIVFVDTEFSTLDPYKGEILSIGIVKINGDSLYLELEYDGEVSDWVKENIIPTLTAPKITRREAIIKINEFVGPSQPYIVAYVNQFDVIYWYKLLRPDNDPSYWLPIDFASMLFTLGIDPERYGREHKNSFLQDIGIDPSKYKEHNALDDARILREVYLRLTEEVRREE